MTALRETDLERKLLEEVISERTKQKKSTQDIEDIMTKAVAAAVIIGLLVTAYFIFEVKETYSALYIKPDSYSNYVTNNSIKFIYGVKCFEEEQTSYTAQMYLNNASIGVNNFNITPGETKEWQVQTDIPEYTPTQPTTGLKA